VKRCQVLAVSSGGGHWVELMRLRPAFEGLDVAYATVRECDRKDVGDAPFFTFGDVTRWNKVKWILTAAQILWILVRVRPRVILSTGALPGYMTLVLGRLVGARCIWLDSIANVDELSLSGQRAGRIADLWLTQWPHLTTESGPSFKGSVL